MIIIGSFVIVGNPYFCQVTTSTVLIFMP